MRMQFDMGGVDHQPLQVGTQIGVINHLVQQVGPDAPVPPATETAMGVLPVPIVRWQVPPGSPRAQVPKYRVQKQAVVPGWPPPLASSPRQMRLQHFPNSVRNVVPTMRWRHTSTPHLIPFSVIYQLYLILTTPLNVIIDSGDGGVVTRSDTSEPALPVWLKGLPYQGSYSKVDEAVRFILGRYDQGLLTDEAKVDDEIDCLFEGDNFRVDTLVPSDRVDEVTAWMETQGVTVSSDYIFDHFGKKIVSAFVPITQVGALSELDAVEKVTTGNCTSMIEHDGSGLEPWMWEQGNEGGSSGPASNTKQATQAAISQTGDPTPEPTLAPTPIPTPLPDPVRPVLAQAEEECPPTPTPIIRCRSYPDGTELCGTPIPATPTPQYPTLNNFSRMAEEAEDQTRSGEESEDVPMAFLRIGLRDGVSASTMHQWLLDNNIPETSGWQNELENGLPAIIYVGEGYVDANLPATLLIALAQHKDFAWVDNACNIWGCPPWSSLKIRERNP